MIHFLIYILIKKYRNLSLKVIYAHLNQFLNTHVHIFFLTQLVILLVLIPVFSKSQNRQLNYKILKSGHEIGWMTLEKNITGNKLNLVLNSEIKIKMIFQINVLAKETAEFDDGKLIQSSQFRKTNGDIKVNKQTRFVSDKYEVVENGEKQNLDYQYIGTNLLSLYFEQPDGINMLYCDKHECFITITKTEDGGYKVKFPDGNSNVFYYSGGICTKIMIEHTFYTATIIIKP